MKIDVTTAWSRRVSNLNLSLESKSLGHGDTFINFTGPQNKLLVLGMQYIFSNIVFTTEHGSKVKIEAQSTKNEEKRKMIFKQNDSFQSL